jgi:hypothetical protein
MAAKGASCYYSAKRGRNANSETCEKWFANADAATRGKIRGTGGGEMMAAGDPKKTSVFLAESVHRALRVRAAEEGITLSEAAARILEEVLLPKPKDADATDQPTVH